MDPIVSRGFSQLPERQFGVSGNKRQARSDAWSTGRKIWKANLTEHGYKLMFGPTLEAKLSHCSHIPFVAYHLPALLKVIHLLLEKSISCSPAWPLWPIYIVFCWKKPLVFTKPRSHLYSSTPCWIIWDNFWPAKFEKRTGNYLDSTLPLVAWIITDPGFW